MKTIVDYILEHTTIETNITEGSHDAEKSANEIMKGILNKKMTLDEISELLAEEGWEFNEEVPGENGDNDMLVYVANFTNNANGDDDYLDIKVEKHGDMYKILSYTLE